jgi:hypothetical protein
MTRSTLAAVGAALIAAGAPGCDDGHGGTGSPQAPGKGGKTDCPGCAAGIAPDWLVSPLGEGTWDEAAKTVPDGRTFASVRGWVDARVANRRVHKRVFVEVAAPYGDAVIRTLLPAWFEATLDGGAERWGTDAIEVWPDGGPNGASLTGPVLYRLRVQEDPEGDGGDAMYVTPWRRLYGSGEWAGPSPDPWAPGWQSPARPAASPAPPSVLYPPFDDAGAAVAARIDRVIAAKASDPQGIHTVHAAVFNINDPRVTDRLIAAHRAGVDVRLVTEATKLRPWSFWQTEDDRLLAAGVPLLAVRRPGRGSMHLKLALFDGRVVETGSFNWEVGSSTENHEDVVFLEDPGLVAAYADRFEAVAGGVLRPRSEAADPGSPASISFAPDERPYAIAGDLIDAARERLSIAMFTAKDVEWAEGGRTLSLWGKLGDAAARGVRVTLVTDFGVAEGGDYFGVTSPDDPADERLEGLGVRVVRADNPFGTYASMHHKFMVADGEVVAVGAFNWYWDAAYLNDEDQVVLRDPSLAADFEGEFADLLARYDPGFVPSEWPTVEVRFAVTHAGTLPGDTVVLVGDAPELGAWDPAAGVGCDPSAWPTWTASVRLAAGVRVRFKAAVRHPDGSVSWEAGDDRTLRAPTGVAMADVAVSWR